MKICMVSRIYPPKVGGGGSFLEVLANRLVKHGFDVSIITQQYENEPKKQIKDGIEINRVAKLGKQEYGTINMGLNSIIIAKNIIKQKNVDLFHIHDLSAAGMGGWIAKKVMKQKKFVIKYGGDLVYEYLSLNKFPGWDSKKNLEGTLEYQSGFAGFLHNLEDTYFKDYDCVLPDSEYGKDFLIKRGVSEDKLNILKNGVNTSRFKCTDKKLARHELGLDGIVLFTAARFVEWKGVDILIMAMAEATKENKDLKLIIAGEGPEKENYIKLIHNLNLQKNIVLVGNISRGEMVKYHNAADIFILPSYFDTTPNVLLEANGQTTSSAISIANSRKYFKIDNVKVTNSSFTGGIFLTNTTNGIISNNNFTDNNAYGIYLWT